MRAVSVPVFRAGRSEHVRAAGDELESEANDRFRREFGQAERFGDGVVVQRQKFVADDDRHWAAGRERECFWVDAQSEQIGVESFGENVGVHLLAEQTRAAFGAERQTHHAFWINAGDAGNSAQAIEHRRIEAGGAEQTRPIHAEKTELERARYDFDQSGVAARTAEVLGESRQRQTERTKKSDRRRRRRDRQQRDEQPPAVRAPFAKQPGARLHSSATTFENEPAIRPAPRAFLIMGDDEQRQVLFTLQIGEQRDDRLRRFGVEISRRLVAKQHARLQQKRARQGEALALPARQAGRPRVGKAVESHAIEEVVRTRFVEPDAGNPRRRGHVLPHRQAGQEQARNLQNETDFFSLAQQSHDRVRTGRASAHPARVTSPSKFGSSEETIESNVLFPAPERPVTASDSPVASVKLTSWRIVCAPARFPTACAEIISWFAATSARSGAVRKPGLRAISVAPADCKCS